MLVSPALLTRQTKVKVFPAFHHHHLFSFSLSSAGNLYPGKRKMFVLGKVVCYPLYFQSNIRGKGRRGSEGRKRNLFKSFRLAMPSTSSTRRSGQPKWPPLSFNKQLMLTAIMVERVEKWKPLPDLFFSQNAKPPLLLVAGVEKLRSNWCCSFKGNTYLVLL